MTGFVEWGGALVHSVCAAAGRDGRSQGKAFKCIMAVQQSGAKAADFVDRGEFPSLVQKRCVALKAIISGSILL